MAEGNERVPDLPADLVAIHLTRVEKAQGLPQQVRNFSGEGYKRFTDWLKEAEKACISVSAPNKAKCTCTSHTDGSALGPAADFLVRKVRENPDISWADLKTALKDRFGDLSDVQYAQQNLKKT